MMAGPPNNGMTSANLQGVVSNFCSVQKLTTITELIAQAETGQSVETRSSSLESSVRSYGQNWDFRENIWKQSTIVQSWLLEEEPAQLAADLLDTSAIWLLRDQTYFKRPGSEQTPWHQDAMFIPVRDCTFLTLWIPLSPINDEFDSPLEYWSPPAPGCHFLEGSSATASFITHQRNWMAQGWQHLTTLGLQPGDCSYHDGWTLHGSKPHEASADRLAFVAVYGCGEGELHLAPAMPHAPDSLRNQAHLLRAGLHDSCFKGLKEGDPIPSHHNPWIRCSPRQKLPIHSAEPTNLP